jgi:gliding motility-associated-like protein
MLTFETSNPSLSIISNSLIYYVQTIVVDALTTNFFSCQGASASGHLPNTYRFLYGDPADAQSLNFTFLWTPSTYLTSTNTASPYVTLPGVPPPSGTGPSSPAINYNFTLTVTNTNYGCTASNTQTATLFSPRKVGVANVFRPDGTPPDNVFVPRNIEDYPGAIFSIYNRWGMRIFHSQGPTKADYTWDGRYNGVPQPMEVYVWYVTLPYCLTNIFSASNGDGVNHGDVTLLR